MTEHKYKITYKIERHQQGLTKEEISERSKLFGEDIGACDNIILVSLIGIPGNSEPLSVLFTSMTGDGTVGFESWTPTQAGVVEADAKDLVEAGLATVARVVSTGAVQYRLYF